MNRTLMVILSLSLGMITPGLASAQRPSAVTRGCASPIVLNSSIKQLVLKCDQNNAELVKIIARLNDLAARKALSAGDLQDFANGFNAKIDKVSNDTDEILLLLKEVMNRLDAASASPGRAPKLLGPYMSAATDISNRSYEFNEFLDVNGRTEYRFVFSLSGDCQIFIVPPRGTGFTVGLAVESDAGSPIWRSLMGTQGRYSPIPLSTGVYQFRMFARRDAGQYSGTISARCQGG